MSRVRSIRWVSLGMLVALLALGAGVDRASAVHENESLPGHIHSGTCEELGDVVIPLTNATTEGLAMSAMEGTPSAEPIDVDDKAGAEEATVPLNSSTVVDVSLEEIIEGGHAINFHESEDNIENYVACGEVGGFVTDADSDDGGTLVIGLRTVNPVDYEGTTVRYSGIAVLQGMGDQTQVTVFVAPGLAGAPAAAATPAASADGEAAADAVMVDIQGFAYNPDPVEVPVGGTVTWTNQDGAPHTATATEDRELLQSGTLGQGDSYSETFDEAGEYAYFCEFHSQMAGTIVVE